MPQLAIFDLDQIALLSLKNFLAQYPIAVLLTVTLLVWLAFFGPVIYAPNAYLFSHGGDAMNNYYNPAWYIKHGSGTHFEGMNYPYGTHIIYADSHPLFALSMRWFCQHIWDVSDYSIGIMNFGMVFSIIPCVLLLFLILRRCHLPSWYAGCTAILIGFMSPQMSRMLAHYALSYMFIIPLWWYCMIRLLEGEKTWLWGLIYALATSVFGLTHMYFLPMGILFMLLYLMVDGLYHWGQWRTRWGRMLIGLGAIIVPFLIINTFLAFTDNTTDLHPNPWGFYFTYATLESIFIPRSGWMREVYNGLGGNDFFFPEGEAFVGLLGGLAVLLMGLRLVGYGLKKQWSRLWKPVVPYALQPALLTGLLVLLFAMAFPFRLGLDELRDWIPNFRQFRSLGRFAWIFYYLLSVYAAFVLYQVFVWLQRSQLWKRWAWLQGLYPYRKPLAWTVLVGLLLHWGWEAGTYTHRIADYLTLDKEKNAEDFLDPALGASAWLKEAHYAPGDFQAILSVPFFLHGSEKLYIQRSLPAHFNGLMASYQTGLPITHGWLGRANIGQSFRLAQQLSTDFIDKPVLDDFPNQKPLLLITTNERLDPPEQALANKAKKIWSNETVFLYALPIDSMRSHRQAYWQYFQQNRDSFFQYQDDSTHFYSHYDPNFLHQGFDDPPNAYALWGNGGWYQKEGPLMLMDRAVGAFKDSSQYELSVWIKALRTVPAFPVLEYRQMDQSGQVIDQQQVNPKYLTEVYDEWVKATITFYLQKPGNKVQVWLEGQEIQVDEVLLRPVKAHAYYYQAPVLIQDNYCLDGCVGIPYNQGR